ncbi:hypothetical protein DER45DRAFT_604275 [Fusarium avenaceum]|nr:hypothetical protein DER45DRAFT_604275 [Fusarium avenaceum]
MATSLPQEVAWPAEFREHATQLGRYLKDTLLYIERAKDQPIPYDLARTMAIGALSLINKINNIPDRTLEGIRESHERQDETKAAAKESIDIGRIVIRLVREAKDTEQYNRSGTLRTYISIVAGNGLAISIYNPLIQPKTPPSQVLSEIIVNIRNPLTVASLRAMNPRSLKAHVDRAIEQSGNEHIEKIKTALTNQLKSGDLSIKTATTSDMEILRQFAEDWEHRLGIRASIRIPTYGVLVHGIRTSSMDENRPFIPNAGIKYIGWLTRIVTTKSVSSIINEGLIWQGEVFQCELYDRSCRLRQCFSCQRYGHIGTQCKATTRCGYCA